MESDNNFKIVSGGVTAAQGFKACGIHAGLKKKKEDLALLYCDNICTTAGVFTKNKVKAAPLLYSMDIVAKGQAQALVVNSGNANACTGEAGAQDVLCTADTVAGEMAIKRDLVLVASTGVIGVKLPMDKITAGIKKAVPLLSADGGYAAARAIMTTDLKDKQIAVTFTLDGRQVTVGGMAKGSGMIHPNMGTMLCFITTNAAISAPQLDRALRLSVDDTFNMITVDGDTSTNDTAVVMANGLAGNKLIDCENRAFWLFKEALQYVCCFLAKEIARDGEGATKLLEVTVNNAASKEDARLLAKSVAGSNLVKTAVFGEDANWGRIITAAGYSGANFEPGKCSIFIGEEQMAADGCGLDFSEERAKKILEEDCVKVTLDLGCGEYNATAWGCDLSYEYVRINGSYRS